MWRHHLNKAAQHLFEFLFSRKKKHKIEIEEENASLLRTLFYWIYLKFLFGEAKGSPRKNTLNMLITFDRVTEIILSWDSPIL